MNAPYLSEHFESAVVPTVPVRQMRDLTIGTYVSGTFVSRERLHLGFGDLNVWALEVALEGGMTGRFGCSDENMKVFGKMAVRGQSFTALVSSGVGPAPGGLDLEPSSVFYLADIELGEVRRMPVPRTAQYQDVPTLSTVS